jgi:hypothetical protein
MRARQETTMNVACAEFLIRFQRRFMQRAMS